MLDAVYGRANGERKSFFFFYGGQVLHLNHHFLAAVSETLTWLTLSLLARNPITPAASLPLLGHYSHNSMGLCEENSSLAASDSSSPAVDVKYDVEKCNYFSTSLKEDELRIDSTCLKLEACCLWVMRF